MTNIDKNEEAVRKALPELKMPRGDKNFSPPIHQGLHELIESLEQQLELANSTAKVLKHRLREFETTASQFLGKANDTP